MFRFKTYCAMLLAAAFGLIGRPMLAQESGKNLQQKVGKYAVELRLPVDGLYADEETDIEFHVADASQDDPVQGPPPVIRAKVSARVTMPAMSSMPAQSPQTHTEGVPGDYGVVTYFPHGGEYQLDLTITPPEDKAFTASFRVPVEDASATRKPRPRPYTLEVTSRPVLPKAGEPTELSILIRGRETKQPVTEFDTVHERTIHFMVVSKDLQHFAHEHPETGAGGKFTLRYTFPTAGEYHLFADVAPKGAGSQILMQPIHVGGAPSSGSETLTPSPTVEAVGGVKLAFQTDTASLPSRRMTPLTFTLKDASTGAPITDLEPYLGAMAHLMLIQQDGVTFVHCHPDESDPTNGHQGTLTFLARFPKPGRYKGWIQFQRAGQVQTAAFVIATKAEGGKS